LISEFRLNEGLLDWLSLLVLGRRRLSTLPVDVLYPSARSNWSVVITALRLSYCRSRPKGPRLPITWLPLLQHNVFPGSSDSTYMWLH